MTQEDKIFTKTAGVIADLFGVDENQLSIETLREQITEWDSLQHVNLVIDIERHFGIHLPEEVVVGVRSIRDLVQAIAEQQQRPNV